MSLTLNTERASDRASGYHYLTNLIFTCNETLGTTLVRFKGRRFFVAIQ